MYPLYSYSNKTIKIICQSVEIYAFCINTMCVNVAVHVLSCSIYMYVYRFAFTVVSHIYDSRELLSLIVN